jgi:predicted RNase H-like nuclease (RuvC/YqgF family)
VSYEMEAEDFIRAKDIEIRALREELHRERMKSARLEDEVGSLYRAAQTATRDNMDLRKRLQAYIDEADEDIRLAAARRAELEAIEL